MVELRRFGSLGGVAGLAHGVSTRVGGVSEGRCATLNLGEASGDDPAAVAENRRRVAEALGFAGMRTARQVHGRRVVEVSDPAHDPGEADALVVSKPGILVGVLGADCPGVLLVDPVRRVLAVVHAGWRGTAAGVVREAIDTMARRSGSTPQALRAGIGPGIGGARYEVGPEVVAALRAAGVAGEPGVVRPLGGDRSCVDLAAALCAQLVSAGIPPGSIERMHGCTFSEPGTFFSHRRDGPGTGRHALLAGWAGAE